MNIKNNTLKLALFATGLSGIVAEYILATLATYLVGNSVFQWTIVLSIMLFSMGLGSRISKRIEENLLINFIYIEFALSMLVAFSAIISYTVASYSAFVQVIIYLQSIAIGFLIGMEIPLAVRINNSYESLRTNISSVLENDYYGSLIGGLFFAFVGLPYLTLTQTPFVLGLINFLVAILLYLQQGRKQNRITIWVLAGFISIALIAGSVFAEPIILYGQQKKYKDKVVFEKQSKYQNIVITQWKNNYWLYINGNQQLCSFDEVMYHEPIVHPVMQLHGNPQDILILGGGDGCAAREVLKYPSIEHITLVDIDSVITNIGKNNEILKALNKGSMLDRKLSIVNEDAFTFLENGSAFYDVIIIDLPDPKSIELSRLYSEEFYSLCKNSLRAKGYLVTQAGSPYFATNAYLCINKTMQTTGFSTLKLHNQIVTMGEWGWILGAKEHISEEDLKERLLLITYKNVETQWINNEANKLMISFGKNFYVGHEKDSIVVNTILNPVLMQYYRKGNWDIY